LQGAALDGFSVEERMSWAAKRKTKLEEDLTYCLLGLVGVYLPLIYGEGRENAIARLETAISEQLRRKNYANTPAGTCKLLIFLYLASKYYAVSSECSCIHCYRIA